MKPDELLKDDRYDLLCNIANMYYNQGMTKQEIAAACDITRFKAAKLLQEALVNRIVDIRIQYKSMRNTDMETELMRRYPLKRAVVINTQYSPYLDGRLQFGKMGANYLNKVLTPNSVLGITWGKTLQSVISQLPQIANNPVTTIQLAGRLPLDNSSLQTEALMRTISNTYFGPCNFLYAPLYINNPKVKAGLLKEPTIVQTIKEAKKLTVALTGIGGYSSLPFFNPQFADYITKEDKEAMESCIGSICGYILNKEGDIADIPLNHKVMTIPLDIIMKTPRRIAVVYGKHKTKMTALVLRKNYVNELITDANTARTLLE